MTRRLAASLMAIILTAPLTLSAHDASKHKGKPTMGEIASIEDGKISLKTEEGVKTIKVNEETAILDGESQDGSVQARGRRPRDCAWDHSGRRRGRRQGDHEGDGLIGWDEDGRYERARPQEDGTQAVGA